MIKFLFLFIVPLLFGLFSRKNSLLRTNRELFSDSTELSEPILKSLINRIAKMLEITDIPVRIHEVRTFNGLATSDGRIFLTRGALDAFYAGKVTAEELSSVVAHELGHVALGHAKRRIIDFSMQNALRIILSLTIGRLIPAVGIYIANFISSLLAAKLSRNDEFEADEYASALLCKAGIGTEPQISLLKKLDSLVLTAGAAPQWLQSHPSVDERIKAISNLQHKWSDKNPR